MYAGVPRTAPVPVRSGVDTAIVRPVSRSPTGRPRRSSASSTCVEELRSYRKQNEQPDLGGALAPHIRVTEAACRTRGSYVWKTGQFVKVAGPR